MQEAGWLFPTACSMPWHFPRSLPECKPRFRHKSDSGSLPDPPFFLSGTPETAPLPIPPTARLSGHQRNLTGI